MQTRADWLIAAIAAALEAGSAILDVYGSADFAIEKKADDSPLTRADRRSHSIIKRAIEDFGIPVLSEEGWEIPFEVRRSWPQMWVVDPLDGTKEFIKRNGEFTVNIALVEDGVPTLGVIFVPVADSLYFADADLGAFKIDAVHATAIPDAMASGKAMAIDALKKAAQRLPVPQPEGRPFTVMGSRSHATPELEACVDEMRKTHERMEFIAAGSSLKICRVAEGVADVYPRLGPTMEWDTAAGQAIATASGARVVRHDNGRPLAYNKEDLHNPWFIVERP